MSMTTTWELNESQTALWEEDSSEGREFRESIRSRFTHSVLVEVRSHDGIVLDAWATEEF